MSSRTRARAHAAQRYRHADLSPVEWRGLVIAAPGDIDVDAIDRATIVTQRDAASIAAGLQKRAASAARATAKATAELEERRAAMGSALRARHEAAARRAQATGRFEGFERALRAVVDATYSLVAANAEAAEAVARVEVTAGRLSELSVHRRALEVSAEEARHRAEHAARLRSDQEAVTSLNAVVLERGTEVAERARVEAEAAS